MQQLPPLTGNILSSFLSILVVPHTHLALPLRETGNPLQDMFVQTGLLPLRPQIAGNTYHVMDKTLCTAFTLAEILNEAAM